MSLRRSPVRYALAIAGLGALVTAVNVFLLFTYPQQFLPEAAETQYLETWFRPVAAVSGTIILYGIPLLTAVGGYYFLKTDRASIVKILVGFAIGGVVFGFTTVGIGWAITDPRIRQSPLYYVGRALWATVRFGGPAVLGVLAAWVIDNRRGRVIPTTD